MGAKRFFFFYYYNFFFLFVTPARQSVWPTRRYLYLEYLYKGTLPILYPMALYDFRRRWRSGKKWTESPLLLITAKTNTNSCQARNLVNFTNVAPAYSSIQYRQIFWYHLIEETHSYRHVWKFPENISKYLYGGTFEKCKLFIDTHCIHRKTFI